MVRVLIAGEHLGRRSRRPSAGFQRGRWLRRTLLVFPAVAVSVGCEEPLEPAFEVTFQAVTAGGFHSCGLGRDGTAYCWGSNSSGQLGTGSARPWVRRPQPVAGSVRFEELAAGDGHTCGVAVSGRVYCWGRNDWGQLGDGTRASRRVPVAVVGVSRAVTVSAGRAHTCAVLEGGEGVCWGANEEGRLGDGSTVSRVVPVALAGGLRFLGVSAGGFHTCGLTVAGSAYCWGGRGTAELGIGVRSGSVLPVRAVPLDAVVAVSAGHLYSCAVASSGAAWCWGENAAGQLGDGTRALRGNPTPVAGALRYRVVRAGPGEYTCGVAGDGTAYCWGRSEGVRDAEGRAFESVRPVAVGGGVRFRTVSVGVGHACGMATDGRAYCWGLGGSGQLGHGVAEDRSEPVAVAGQG